MTAETPVALEFSAARHALDRALADGGLVAESRRAYAEGLVFVMPVGPRGANGPAREVVVRLLPARESHPNLVVPLRWEVARDHGLFPALDANLELSAAGERESRLAIVGTYDPPLGRVGQVLDRLVMSKVAQSTMSALLREVAATLERLAG